MSVFTSPNLKCTSFLVTISLFVCFNSFAQQKDSIYGKVKSIREKVIFLTEKQNPQFMYYDDYGHSGFMGPESTIARFNYTWFSTASCYYINYERSFNENGKLLVDKWFSKQDSLLIGYYYTYDEKERLIRKVDSSENSASIEEHFYSGYSNKSIIYQNLEYRFFSHKYKQYNKQKQLIREKSMDDWGTIDEYEYVYNADGNLLYRIYKDPNSWEKVNEKKWSFGSNDSVVNVYKDIVNEYDAEGRLIKNQQFDLYEARNEEGIPILTETNIYNYEQQNLSYSSRTIHTNNNLQFNTYFVYDAKNRLKEKYCCNLNKEEARRVEKYKYENDKISSLTFTRKEDYKDNLLTYQVSFSYTFDAKGNWTEILKTVDGVPLYKWKRELTYYN